MNNFKSFYNDKKGKAMLFFGFYLIFFIFVAIYFKSNNINMTNTNKEEAIEEEKKLTTYNINNLVNNDFQYEIVIFDESDMKVFKGSKNNVDYDNYENKYFLDIYNINQLLKRSKYVNSDKYVLYYEISNSILNDILLTEKQDGVNKIEVHVDYNGGVEKISMDLSKYFGKETFQINISYIVGEKNENSSS